MRTLADLEAKLLEDQARAEHTTVCSPAIFKWSAPTPPADFQPQTSAAAKPPPKDTPSHSTSGQQARGSTTRNKVQASRSATATEDRTAGNPVTRTGAPAKKRNQKLTRAEFEAYRDSRKTEDTTYKENVQFSVGRKRRAQELSEAESRGGHVETDLS